MRIAWLDGEEKYYGGLTTYSFETTKRLELRRHEVHLFRFCKTERAEKNVSSLQKIPYLFRTPIRHYYLPNLKTKNFIKENLLKIRPRVVHVSLAPSLLDYTIPDICHQLGIPIVGTFHAPLDKKTTFSSTLAKTFYAIYSPALKKFDRIIIFSEYQRSVLEKLGLDGQKVRVLPNGVDTSFYAPGKSSLGKKIADFIILYLGRLETEKNIDLLINLFKEDGFLPKSKLLIVGDGSQAKVLKTIAGKNKRVIFWGRENNLHKKLALLRAADIFVLPSSIEGLSLSLLEAMSTGLAIVASDAGADGDALIGAGYVISTQNIEPELKKGLDFLYQNPEVVKILGQKARKKALSLYSLDKNIVKLEQIYKEL